MYPNWINSLSINKSIFNEKFLKIGFSQNGEDEIIREFFWNDILSNSNRTYLDIGCFHETLYSNTKLLNLAGWHGIAVDANPDMQKQWITRRRADTFYNLGIKSSECGQHSQSLKFYRFEDGAINTFDKKLAKNWISKGFKFMDIIDVKCKRLQEVANLILSTNPNFKPAFLNIDIEQVDYLNDLPEFLKLMNAPSLICIEWISQEFGINNYKESKEFQLLSSCGYKILNIVGGNLFATCIK